MCYGTALLVAIIAMQEVKTKITIEKKKQLLQYKKLKQKLP